MPEVHATTMDRLSSMAEQRAASGDRAGIGSYLNLRLLVGFNCQAGQAVPSALWVRRSPAERTTRGTVSPSQ